MTMDSAARAALLGAVLLPRLSAETIQEHLLELGKQSFEVRSQEWVTSTLDDDVFGDNFGTNPDFSYDDPRNYPVSRDFENPRHACFEDDAAFPWVKFSDARSLATVNYFPSTPAFQNFENLDLIPENSHLYPRYNKLRGGGSYANEGFEVRHKHCEVPSDSDGGTWSIEMIGPMYSTGGYDWWQLGWADLWKLGDKYDEHGTIYVTDASIVTRDAKTGTTLGYPPIHIHHIHIGPQPGVRPRTGEYDCGSLPKPCNNVSWFFEWHGDYECDDDEGGADCLYEKSPKGIARDIHEKVDLEGEINDVRAAGDEAFGWYFEVAIKWFTHDKILEKMGGVEPRPLSTFFNVGVPGRFDMNNQQTYVGTFPAPIAYDSVIWYNMRMFNNGILIRWKFHSHLLSFYKFMLVSGDVRDLLDERFNLAPLWKRKFYGEPWNVEDLGFENADGHFREMYEKVGEHPDLEMLCLAETDLVTRGGYLYDRRPPARCRRWQWKEGDGVFGIGWNLKKTFKHTINEKPGSNGLLVDGTLPQHLSFTLQHIDLDRGNSRYTCFRAKAVWDTMDKDTSANAALLKGTCEDGVPHALFWIAFPLRGLYPDRTWGVFYACLLASVLSVVLLLCTGAAAAVKLALKAKKI